MPSIFGMAMKMGPNIFGKYGDQVVGVATGAIFAGTAYSQYKTDRAKGRGIPYSALHGFTQAVLWNDFFLPMAALSVAPLVPLINQQYQNYAGNMEQSLMPFSPWRLNDGPSGLGPSTQTEGAQTSRARAIQAIQESRLNARSYIGSEASYFHTRYR